LTPTLCLKDQLQRYIANMANLSAGAVEHDVDADTSLIKLGLKSSAIDFHLTEAHYRLQIKAVVLCFDFAPMIDGFLRNTRLCLSQAKDAAEDYCDTNTHSTLLPRRLFGLKL
jgi:hypothetical protein